MKLVSRRVANFALAASLTFVIGVLPCSTWMIGSQSGHECCDHSSKHSSDPKTTCELLCAISGSPFTVAQKQGVQKTEVSAVLLAAESCALVSESKQDRLLVRMPWSSTESRR